jgi:hypothetical protein
VRLWKIELQKLANELKFPITVCHLHRWEHQSAKDTRKPRGGRTRASNPGILGSTFFALS